MRSSDSTSAVIADRAHHQHRQDQLPRQAGEEDHVQAGRQHQDRGAQVGLLDDQAHRHASSSSATTKSSARSWPSRRWNHQASISGIAIFRISLRLDHHAEVEPARRALLGDAEQRRRHQQRHAHQRTAARPAPSASAAGPARRRTARRARAACCARGRRSACRGRSRPSTSSPGRPPASSSDGQRERAVEAGEHRRDALPGRRPLEGGAHRRRRGAVPACSIPRARAGDAPRATRCVARHGRRQRDRGGTGQRHRRWRAAACRSARSTCPRG